MKSLQSLLLVAALSLSACKRGPDIETCIVGDQSALCTDNRLPKDQRKYDKSIPALLNYTGTNANDFETLIKTKCVEVQVEVCAFNDDGSAECYDPRLDQGYTRTRAQTLNYVATNPNDFETLLQWRFKRCEQ